jgi:crossover junction endodeoxyribonuclease RusA
MTQHFDPITIWIEGRVVPYTRMTQRGKYVKPDAVRYIDSQNRLKSVIARDTTEYMRGEWYVPEKCQFGAHMTFYVASLHKCDLDNLVKAVMDACQKVLFKDDRYCDTIFATRVLSGEHDEGVAITLYEIDNDVPF